MGKLLATLSLFTLLSFSGNKVLICVSPGASKYHAYKCQGLNHCKHTIEEVTLAEAQQRGYTACGFCY